MPRGKNRKPREPSWIDLEVQRRNVQRRAAQYGITPDDFIRMKQEQGGRCAICRETEELVIDHDHGTGEVRGLLCRNCNIGLGMFSDNVVSLAAAIFYLGRANGMRPNVRPDLPIHEPSLYAAWRKAGKRHVPDPE